MVYNYCNDDFSKQSVTRREVEVMLLSTLLIAIGVMYLVVLMGWFSAGVFKMVLAVLAILAGVWMMMNGTDPSDRWFSAGGRKKR